MSINDVNLSIDAGFYEGATLGNRVWFDNEGGTPNMFDGGDTPVVGIPVTLYSVDISNGDRAFIETQMTDANGQYLFRRLRANTYQVEIEITDEFEFVASNQGGEDVDSDINEQIDLIGVILPVSYTHLTLPTICSV